MAKKTAPKRKTVAKKARGGRKPAAAAARRRTAPRAKALQKARKAKPAKAARKATKPVARKAAARKVVAKKVVAKKVVAKKVVARKAVAKKPVVAKRVVAAKTPARKVVAKSVAATRLAAKPAGRAAAPAAKPVTPVKTPAVQARKVPSLDRERRIVRESDMLPTPPSSLVPQRHASAASSGADELRVKLAHQTSSGPELTAGDVDADWQTAETSGDEAPGGDNPTPDQDVVEEIGRALGVQYDDDEELRGGDEIAQRDHDRWELDPASSEDFEDR